MKGKELKVPQGYRGVIVREIAENEAAQNARKQTQLDEEDDENDEEDVSEIREIGSFDEIMLWGHESIIEDDDTFAKGMGEWIKFAELVSPFEGLEQGMCDLGADF